MGSVKIQLNAGEYMPS